MRLIAFIYARLDMNFPLYRLQNMNIANKTSADLDSN